MSIWMMVLANLRRRKLQSLLVAMVIGLSVLLFFTGVGLAKELSGPFERMFEAQRGSHLGIRLDSRVYDVDEILEWWRTREGVIAVTPPMASIDLDGSAFVEGREINSLLFMVERPLATLQQDDLRAVAGEPATVPAPGEVWVPTSVARETQIEVGDELELPTFDGLKPFRVSAVVVDPQFSGPFNNPKRIWLGPGQLPYHFELSKLSEVMFGVRLQDPDQYEALWFEFLDHQGGSFSGQMIDYAGMRLGYMAPYSLITAMLIAFSLLSVLIALFAIAGTITAAILADFRTIGILRGQGFTPRDVRNVYRVQYLVLALIAVPVGILLGYPLVRLGVELLMSTTGAASQDSSLFLVAMATGVAFVFLIWLFVGRVSKRAERVRPSQAIRYGANIDAAAKASGPSVERLAALPLGKWSVPFLVAVKNLGLQKRRALLLALSVLFATLAACLAVNLDHSFLEAGKDPSLLGFDSADVRVTRAGRRFGMRHDNMMAILTEHPEIASVATSDFVEGELVMPGERARTLIGTLVAGDMEALGYRNLEGRNPEGADEVSVGVNTARTHGFEIGDTLPLYFAGQSVPLRITGIYQTLNNGGTGFRVRLEAMRLADPMYEPKMYGLMLEPNVDQTTFIETLESEYGEAVDAQAGDYFVRSILMTVVQGMRVSNGFLALVFLAAASILIFNGTLMSLAENRRTFGVLKTVGMTPSQLRASVAIGVAIVSAVGIVLGILCWQIGAPIGLSILFTGLGLVSFPLQNSVFGTLLLIPIVLGFCLVSAWWPSRRLLEVDPRTLIVE